MFWGKTRAKRAVHCPFGSDFGSNKKITVSIVALDMYDQYLSDCLKSLCSIMPGRKNRAKWAVRFFTTRLAVVFIRGILVVFSLLESTPHIVGHLVYMLSCHLVTERFREKKLNFVYHFFGTPGIKALKLCNSETFRIKKIPHWLSRLHRALKLSKQATDSVWPIHIDIASPPIW